MSKSARKTSLSFSKSIYPHAIVLKAVNHYSEHVDIRSRTTASDTIVDIFGEEQAAIDGIAGEFGNYVLYLTREVQSHT
jgi:hypothetical protein